MSEQLTHYLHRLVYFETLTPDALQHLAQHLIRRTFTQGETIFLEGDRASGMWLVDQGRVKVFKVNPEGIEHILHILGEGNTFNDIAALDGGNNPASASALSDVTLWLLPSESLTEIVLNDSRLALQVIRVLAARVRSIVGQIEDLALYSVIVRLARFLLKQIEDPALTGPGVTRTSIAAHLATTPQTISNVLRTLEESGAIQFDRHHIVIVDENLLRSIAML